MLSMKAKYALRALCTLAEPGRGLTPARVLAAEAMVPEKFLEATTWDAAVSEAFAGDDEDVSDQEESCS